MIISALSKYYDILLKDENCQIASNGFCWAKAGFEFIIDKNAKLIAIVSLEETVIEGKNERKILKNVLVPQQEITTSGIKSNFLCENAGYVLGLYNPKNEQNKTEKQIEDMKEKCPKRFEAFKELHNTILGDVNNYYGNIFLKYINEFVYEDYEHLINPVIDELNNGRLIIFKVDNQYLHEIDEINDAWLNYLNDRKEQSIIMQCAISGKKTYIANLHPNIKGVKNAQTSGASLISFNAPSYQSYNKSQGLNAPISEDIAFKYTTVLNYLLSSKNNKTQIGDATTVFWAESSNPDYVDFMNFFINPNATKKDEDTDERAVETEKKMKNLLEAYKTGSKIDFSAYNLNPNIKTYILGLSPNASRLSVRFFYTDTFSSFIEKMSQHYKDLAIEKQFQNQSDNIPLWLLINETANPKSKKDINPLLAGSVTRAIITGGMYPKILYNSIINRIRCDRDDSQVNYVRVSIIKAYLSRYARIYNKQEYKEVLTMSLNETTTNTPYLLGRLFAVLEKAQKDANPGINSTIKDRYFSSACATPATVFPTLLKLAQNHISKADYGYISDIRITEILNMIDEPKLPAHLSLEDQGTFILGYYHQSNAFYKKAEQTEKNN